MSQTEQEKLLLSSKYDIFKEIGEKYATKEEHKALLRELKDHYPSWKELQKDYPSWKAILELQKKYVSWRIIASFAGTIILLLIGILVKLICFSPS